MSDIFALFAPLERAGSGDGESLRWALELAGTGPGARVLGAAGRAQYYEPREARRAEFSGDPALIAAFRDEIALWPGQGGSYDDRLIVAAPR